MGDSLRIRADDLRTMLRLAGEAGELPANSDARRRHLLEGVCKLVGGRAAFAFVMSPRPMDGTLLEDGPMLSVGLEPEHEATFHNYLVTPNPRPQNPVVPKVLLRMDPLLTQHRRQCADEGTWYRSDFFEQLQSPMGLDDTLYPRLPLADGRNLAIAIFRPLRDRTPFTDRDCQLVDLFHAEAGRLYGDFGAPPRAAGDPRFHGLPPRLKPVLRHLLAGDGEKQVAVKLGLSRHTVHEYVKVLYRKLGVCSRGELLAQFVRPPEAAAVP